MSNPLTALDSPIKVGITDAQVREDEFVHLDELNDSLFFVSATQYDMICAFLDYCKVNDIDCVDDWTKWSEFLQPFASTFRRSETQI